MKPLVIPRLTEKSFFEGPDKNNKIVPACRLLGNCTGDLLGVLSRNTNIKIIYLSFYHAVAKRYRLIGFKDSKDAIDYVGQNPQQHYTVYAA